MKNDIICGLKTLIYSLNDMDSFIEINMHTNKLNKQINQNSNLLHLIEGNKMEKKSTVCT